MNVKATSPWKWVPSLYFMEGLPFTMVVVVSTIMYKNFGIDNALITYYTGWLVLPIGR
jgi:PAT family beta-lactamase induction signal transducer AmpG